MNNINLITKDIIGASIEVHKTLGPGLLEKVYERALTHELQLRGHKVDTQVRTPIMYKGVDVSIGLEKPLKLDMLVDDEIIVELKSVEKLNEICTKQLLTYLKLKNKRFGLLINFNVSKLTDGVERIVNGY